MGWVRRFLSGFSDSIAKQANSADSRLQSRRSGPNFKVLWRDGSYPLGAVGESNYQAALSKICGGHSRYGHELKCDATLIPEPTNVYDPNAHKVVIDGLLVGYLPREQAQRFKQQTSDAGLSGEVIGVAALINGGWRTNQHDEGSFGVRLGIPLRGDITFADVS